MRDEVRILGVGSAGARFIDHMNDQPLGSGDLSLVKKTTITNRPDLLGEYGSDKVTLLSDCDPSGTREALLSFLDGFDLAVFVAGSEADEDEVAFLSSVIRSVSERWEGCVFIVLFLRHSGTEAGPFGFHPGILPLVDTKCTSVLCPASCVASWRVPRIAPGSTAPADSTLPSDSPGRETSIAFWWLSPSRRRGSTWGMSWTVCG